MKTKWVVTFLRHLENCVPPHKPSKEKDADVEEGEDPIKLFFIGCLGLMKNEVAL